MAVAAAEAKPRRNSSLRLRLLATAVFTPCFIVITQRGDLPFLILVDLIILTGLLEFYALLKNKGFDTARWVGVLCALGISWYAYFRAGVYANALLAVALIALMVFALLRRSVEQAIVHISGTMFGVLYVGWLGSHFILLRELPRLAGYDYALGANYVFLAVWLTWCGDSGAYIIGRAFGKHLLFPRISPRKTREGAVGALAFALLAGYLAQLSFASYLNLPTALGLAALAAVAGMAGDLVESLLKRDSQTKDSGGTIPGHGGTLDRFDSLFFSLPLIYYYHKFFLL